MHIYFAGSIRAGRQDVPVYRGIIDHLGARGRVLTEHVGDAGLTGRGQEQLADSEIHDRDLAWLLGSDVVVAEVTVPSLGVGYEIATAVQRGVPVVALHRGDAPLSAMVSGSGGVRVLPYVEVDALLPQLDRVLDEVLR